MNFENNEISKIREINVQKEFVQSYRIFLEFL